jgi:hypothetical protein
MAVPESAGATIYFESALKEFALISTVSAPITSCNLRIAGRIVRLEIASGMAGVVLPGLSHLIAVESAEPDLTIFVWDSESTGTSLLSPAWAVDDYGRDGVIQGFNDERFHTAVQLDPIILRMLDMETRRAIYWTPSAKSFPYWEFGAPLRPLLHEWLGRCGLVPLHGGAVGFADGGVILAGAGGRGKSNVALACLTSDLFYASDDFCCLSKNPDWVVHSLYCTGKISGHDIVRHPHLRGTERNPDELDHQKAVFVLNDNFADRIIRNMPVRAIVMPRVVGQGITEIVPSTSAVAQKAIAMSTIELSRSGASRIFARVADLVRAVPCYELHVGASLSEVPARLRDLLNALR